MRVALFLTVLAGCSGTQGPTADEPGHRDGKLPTMFTAEQIRAGCPQGRVIELRIEADGKPTTIEHWEFTVVTPEAATIHSVTTDEAGTVLEDATGTSKWTELQEHARFPANATTITENVSVTVPAGTFTTRLYTGLTEDTLSRFWFAADLPGPPVQFSVEKDGKVLRNAQMLRAR